MIKKILLILIIFLLTGCYDHKELNTIAIMTATEINKINNEYIINVQVVNPQSSDKTVNVGSPFFVYEGKGITLHEAYRNIKTQSSRFLYPNHMQLLIVNEKLAKEDISEIIDFYLRIPDTRTEFNVLIGKSDNILNITTPIDDISAISILETMRTNNKYLGITNLVTFNDFANMNLNKNLEIILPSIETVDYTEESTTIENTEKTEIKSLYKLGNLAIFKDNKLLDYLDKDESITYNLIKNKVASILITKECEKDKYITAEATEIKSEISTKNKEININVKMSGNINENMCNIKLNNEKELKKLEKELSKYIKDKIETSINNIRKNYNSDIFGFLDLIYKKDYKTYKEIKDTWYDGEFQNIKINIKSSIDIIGKGNVQEGNNEKN
ncbi:MAG: Ger(x)C family spore germination protein [Bacilli bacterium]|nr:Ger(x)C family spore germination protein [Bacilli bacterium]